MDVPGPHGRSFDGSWRATARVLKQALKFIDSMGWSRRALLPSVNAIIVLAAAFDEADLELSTADIHTVLSAMAMLNGASWRVSRVC